VQNRARQINSAKTETAFVFQLFNETAKEFAKKIADRRKFSKELIVFALLVGPEIVPQDFAVFRFQFVQNMNPSTVQNASVSQATQDKDQFASAYAESMRFMIL
jgi:hypothetical protein